jgi:hypothetical protein
VRHQHQCHVELPTQLPEQLQDLRLDRHVQGRRGLVGDQQPRSRHQGCGDGDPLACSAGKLVRILPQSRLGVGHVHPLEHAESLLASPNAIGTHPDGGGLDQLIPHRQMGRQAARRVLEHEPDSGAANLFEAPLVAPEKFGPVEPHASRDPAVGGKQPRAGKQRLALA